MTITHAEIGFWMAVSLWVCSFLVFLHSLVFRRKRELLAAVYLGVAGLLPQAAGVAVRWMATGRPPFISLYELVSASAWFAVLTYLVIQAGWRSARPIGVVVMPVAFISLGAALTLAPEANALSPTLKSWWLVIHILFALLAHGCFAIAFGAAILMFVKRETPQTENKSLIPLPDRLDQIAVRSIVFGFICHTTMVLSGSVWANNAWGRFWGWDPIETWSLLTWLLYGLYVHLRFLPKWRGRPAAIYAIAAFLIVIFSFWGVPHLWNSVHDYMYYPEKQSLMPSLASPSGLVLEEM